MNQEAKIKLEKFQKIKFICIKENQWQHFGTFISSL